MNYTEKFFCGNGDFAVIALVVAVVSKIVLKYIKFKPIKIALPFLLGAGVYAVYFAILQNSPTSRSLPSAFACGTLSLIYTYAYEYLSGIKKLPKDENLTEIALINLLKEYNATEVDDAVVRIKQVKEASENSNNITEEIYVILLEILPETTESNLLTLALAIVAILENDVT
jgi:hypothetical protein